MCSFSCYRADLSAGADVTLFRPLQRWGSPEHLPAVTVHLAGASLVSDSTASSKKNVLQLTTRSGIQVRSHRALIIRGEILSGVHHARFIYMISFQELHALNELNGDSAFPVLTRSSLTFKRDIVQLDRSGLCRNIRRYSPEEELRYMQEHQNSTRLFVLSGAPIAQAIPVHAV